MKKLVNNVGPSMAVSNSTATSFFRHGLENETNIMVKNAVDVIFGGLGFWMFGFGFTFGDSPGVNAFSGFGRFFTDAEESHMGEVFSLYCFQASFATTATTIVSGAVAERMNLKA